MAATTSPAFSATLQTAVQSKVLATLRNELVWADEALSEHGTFDPMTDSLMFTSYPDISFSAPLTPLTEGTAPSIDAITQDTVLVATAQYGRSVGITDIAKVVAPKHVPGKIAEKTSRQAKEVINRVTRTAIFTGGTPFYGSDDHTTRATLDNTDYLTGAHILKLRSVMKLANIPMFSDGSYKAFLHAEQVYDLKRDTTDDTGWLDVSKYTNQVQDIVRGEIGKLHGVRIIEVNDAPTFSSSVTVRAGVAVGDLKGWGCGDLQTLQFYHTPAGGDHTDPIAQNELFSWKVMFGCAPLNNTYYYRVESYATDL
jgi:N4-gp56 family major capsid protein